jgi:hypothetical protein
MDLVVLAVVVVVVGSVGIAIGLRLAPRLDRWVERRAKTGGQR